MSLEILHMNKIVFPTHSYGIVLSVTVLVSSLSKLKYESDISTGQFIMADINFLNSHPCKSFMKW